MKQTSLVYKIVLTVIIALFFYSVFCIYSITQEFNQRLNELSATIEDTTFRFDVIAFNLATVPPCDEA